MRMLAEGPWTHWLLQTDLPHSATLLWNVYAEFLLMSAAAIASGGLRRGRSQLVVPVVGSSSYLFKDQVYSKNILIWYIIDSHGKWYQRFCFMPGFEKICSFFKNLAMELECFSQGFQFK